MTVDQQVWINVKVTTILITSITRLCNTLYTTKTLDEDLELKSKVEFEILGISETESNWNEIYKLPKVLIYINTY